MKIKMHAMYDHFPAYNPQDGEESIDCYSDTYVSECKGPGRNIALLLEPRSMIGPAYDYCMEHPDYFEYIFTHDSQLLKLPNSKLFLWCDVWLQTDSEKNKGISLCTSYKNWCPLHNARLKIAEHYKDSDKVDVFYGDWNNSEIANVPPQAYLEHYKFSIIIENDIDEKWYTEKILNCFSTKTVPIYHGATKIGEDFNKDGIIEVENWEDIFEIVEKLDIDSEYAIRQQAIEDNYNRLDAYKTPWKERFFDTYGDILEGMMHE